MNSLDKKYIEVNICDFYDFLKDENLSNNIMKYFMDHHCCIYNKNNSFVFERFFCSDELECKEYESVNKEEGCNIDNDFFEIEQEDGILIVPTKRNISNVEKINIQLVTLTKLKDFLREKGYSPYPNYIEKRKEKSKSIVPNYDGVLFDLTW